MKAFVCAAIVALVTVGFVFLASAQEVDEEAGFGGDDAPYFDEEGNVDYEMAEQYAEVVDYYVDSNGTEWEVWLDEIGGLMWGKSVGGSGGLDLIIDFFTPEWVKVWHDGSGTPLYYTRAGSEDGYIEYYGLLSCDGFDLCMQWLVYAWDTPDNADDIEGRGHSASDRCDGYYDGYYAEPDGSWTDSIPTADCWWSLDGYQYRVRGDEDEFNGTADYDGDDRMVRWDYRFGNDDYSTRVYYGGPVIE